VSDLAGVPVDLLVVGSGPAGQKAAIQAAKLGKRVVLVERRERLGGVSIHTGTIPSKTLREAVLEELAQRGADIDPRRAADREEVRVSLLRDRVARVVSAETAVVREQLRRNDVSVLLGEASFVDPHTMVVRRGGDETLVQAEQIVLAVGTVPARPADVEFDDKRVIDSDGLLRLETRVPRTMTVVGAGVTGTEYASMFAALGTRVTVVDQRPRLLPFLDGEIGEALQYLLRRRRVTFRFNEQVSGVELVSGGALTHLRSGKQLPSETVLYATGRQGATAGLDLERVGLSADARGRIPTDDSFQTALPHVYAVGDVAGPPALAATSFEQGRRAALAAFGASMPENLNLVPTGIYAIPEVGMVGLTEEELTEASRAYVAGRARFAELARGVMTGDEDGMLKLLVSRPDRTILGVHVLGTSATDLVHVGQAMMGGGCPSTSWSSRSSTIRPSPRPTRWRGSMRRTSWPPLPARSPVS
jgi:NAD(P) transhydrogenase